jgi:hypothetical protein
MSHRKSIELLTEAGWYVESVGDFGKSDWLGFADLLGICYNQLLAVQLKVFKRYDWETQGRLPTVKPYLTPALHMYLGNPDRRFQLWLWDTDRLDAALLPYRVEEFFRHGSEIEHCPVSPPYLLRRPPKIHRYPVAGVGNRYFGHRPLQ